MLHAVETVDNLNVLVANKELFCQGTFDGVKERLTIVSVDLCRGRTVFRIDDHGDFKISLHPHYESFRLSAFLFALHLSGCDSSISC